MLLGAAHYLAETRNFDGTAVVIFQPAEEGGGGGRAMVEDGLMERFGIEEVYGMHNMPGMPVGDFAIRPGADHGRDRRLRHRRRRAAAATPRSRTAPSTRCWSAPRHRPGAAVDRLAQRRSARSRAVVSVTSFHAETDATNVIPDRVELARHRPDARSPRSATSIEDRMGAIVAAHRRRLRRRRRAHLPPRLPGHRQPAETQTDFAADVAAEIVGDAARRRRRAAGDGRRGLLLHARTRARAP